MKDYQKEIPVHDHLNSTWRSLDVKHPNNVKVCQDTLNELEDLYHEIKIRFDTSPKFYLKEDYQKLLDLLKEIINKYSITDYSTLSDLLLKEIHDREQSYEYMLNYLEQYLKNTTLNVFAGVVNPDGSIRLNIVVDENGIATFVNNN